MGDLSDQLARIVVDASSPDGNISAQVRGRFDISVRFVRGAYGRYVESSLAHQLGQLATLAWTRYRRDYVETVDRFLEEPVTDTGDPGSDRRRYWERLEELVANGESPGGYLWIRSRALVRWEFTIADGTLRSLAEEAFVAELTGAVTDLIADYRAQVVLVTDELFDLGLPSWRKQELAEQR
jgi:hypothetical protein